jgi:Cu/Zn superoxide dismutase
MKKLWGFCMVCLLAVNFFYMASCDDDDDDKSSQKIEKTYALGPLANSGVSGTVTFKKQDNQTTLITVQLSGTQDGNSHPAHIHSGSAGSGGPIVLDFNDVDGATGRGETTVTNWNDGTAVTYEQLIAFNGHVNVHLSAAQLDVMIAQGSIGSNSSGME